MNGDQRICANCAFFVNGGALMGQCHRHPPTRLNVGTFFPRVQVDSWCGEFKAGSR